MIQNCKMRHKNGNCLPAGGFCTENKNICEALQNAYEMGQRNVIRKKGKWIKLDMHAHIADHKCTACGEECYVPTCMGEPMYTYCPNCGARMDGENE